MCREFFFINLSFYAPSFYIILERGFLGFTWIYVGNTGHKRIKSKVKFNFKYYILNFFALFLIFINLNFYLIFTNTN